MKTNMIKVLILCGLFFICLGAFAQVPPPPPGGGHGGTGNQEGGGAPIGSGIGILLVLVLPMEEKNCTRQYTMKIMKWKNDKLWFNLNEVP